MDVNETIGWDDVEEAARKMFTVWINGNELKWAKEAWRHLAAAGLTGAATTLEISATKLRLVTLARIYHEFCGLAWDENPDCPASYLTEHLEIDPVALGILAAATTRQNDFEELTEDDSLLDEAILAVINSQRTEIFECLKSAYGDEIRLYSRMWHTLSDESEKDSEGEEFEVTDAKANALEYVMNGFRSDHVPGT